MAQPPQMLQVGMSLEDSYAILNNNFNTAIQNLSDLGARTSSTVTVTLTVAGGAVGVTSVGLVASGASTSPYTITTPIPASALATASPQATIYVDGTDSAHQWLGASSTLSSGQSNLMMALSVTSPGSNLATITLSIYNLDSVSHTYNILVNVAYVPTTTGIFR